MKDRDSAKIVEPENFPENDRARDRETDERPTYTFEQLLSGMNQQHLHSNIDWGERYGKQKW